ncbi:MAG TPA: hypothetical protein DEQ80_02715 [Anaerolinea thermolimosa]|uniref:Uncharacterized protein n=1 Tax=Anaerolinea thermolimosa TaxID=229919 RepID=A0A3D1JE02_9CHLR|nr:hypothetical protein [Anaerolinea thermolimosa]
MVLGYNPIQLPRRMGKYSVALSFFYKRETSEELPLKKPQTLEESGLRDNLWLIIITPGV